MALRTLIALLLALSFAIESQGQDAEVESSFDVPITFATLSDSPSPTPELGVALRINPASADQQVSDLLLQALQSMGFAIESPQLTLDTFLQDGQQWQSNSVELSPSEIQMYNQTSIDPLPSGSRYAVRYSGRYVFVNSVLRMVLSISLMQRSQLGEYREVNFEFSRRFFVTRLESAVKAEVANRLFSTGPST